jgi:hypothetical protein
LTLKVTMLGLPNAVVVPDPSGQVSVKILNGQPAGVGGGGAASFLDLDDVLFASYAGLANRVIAVNGTATGLVAVEAGGGGGGGATTFLGLTDTPASYSGQGGKGVRVNAGGTALEFIDFATAAALGAVVSTVNSQGDAIDALDTALAGKAATVHAHAIADVTGLQAALDAKAATTHTHAISDTTGLQAALDAKAATTHAHAIADVTGLQAALDAKAATTHTHAISDTTGLQAALDGKAAATHSHAISDTTGLQAALDGKAASTHGHAASDVTSGTFDRARLPTVRQAKTVVIPEPVVGDRFGGYTRRAMTLQQLSAVLVGSSTPSVGWTLRYASDRSAAGTAVVTAGTTTTTTTTAQAVTSLDNAVIPANNHWWLEIASVSGTVEQIEVTLDAEEAA